MEWLGLLCSVVAGAGFLLTGIAAIAQPATLSHLYGLYVHEKNGRGFVRAAGVRDAALGVLLLFFAYRLPGALFAALLVGAAIACADILTVLTTNRRFELAFLGAHMGGAVFLAGSATIVGMSNLSR